MLIWEPHHPWCHESLKICVYWQCKKHLWLTEVLRVEYMENTGSVLLLFTYILEVVNNEMHV